MPRKRKLDRYVSSFVDRGGKERFRFRRGSVSIYLPPSGSPEYRDAYDKALHGVIGIGRVVPGTVNDLCARFYQSVGFKNVSKGWQTTLRQVIEPFREEAGKQRVADFRPRHINVLVARRMEAKAVDGKKVGGTHAAHRFREVMMRLFKFAVAEDMIAKNPVEGSERVRHKVTGYQAWTEADIRQFRARWPLGTKARLALELMLWTALRRGNAHRLAAPVNGLFVDAAVKTGTTFELPVMPALQEAIDAMPADAIGTDCLLLNDYGRPFTAAGFGNKMREWCDAAGLQGRTAHGLRKAATVRAANLGASQQELKALGQWRQDAEVRTYADSANRNRLAADTLARIAEAERLGNIG